MPNFANSKGSSHQTLIRRDNTGHMIKTSMADNGTDWEQTLKIISMTSNTTINLGTGETLFKLTFRRNTNLPYFLDRPPHTKYMKTY